MTTIIEEPRSFSYPLRPAEIEEGEQAGEIDETCPLEDILRTVRDKWSVLVVVRLKSGRMRFSELRRTVDGISQRMLTHTLRQLERDGLVERTVTPSVPVKVEYELTPLGTTLIEPLAVLALWAENNRRAVLRSRASYDGRSDAAL